MKGINMKFYYVTLIALDIDVNDKKRREEQHDNIIFYASTH